MVGITLQAFGCGPDSGTDREMYAAVGLGSSRTALLLFALRPVGRAGSRGLNYPPVRKLAPIALTAPALPLETCSGRSHSAFPVRGARRGPSSPRSPARPPFRPRLHPAGGAGRFEKVVLRGDQGQRGRHRPVHGLL